eukprot:IDg3722t1
MGSAPRPIFAFEKSSCCNIPLYSKSRPRSLPCMDPPSPIAHAHSAHISTLTPHQPRHPIVRGTPPVARTLSIADSQTFLPASNPTPRDDLSHLAHSSLRAAGTPPSIHSSRSLLCSLSIPLSRSSSFSAGDLDWSTIMDLSTHTSP